VVSEQITKWVAGGVRVNTFWSHCTCAHEESDEIGRSAVGVWIGREPLNGNYGHLRSHYRGALRKVGARYDGRQRTLAVLARGK